MLQKNIGKNFIKGEYMITDYYNKLSKTHQGILLMAAGFLLLSYHQGWFFLEGLRELINLALLALSLAAIAYGFYKLDGPTKILHLLNQKPKNPGE